MQSSAKRRRLDLILEAISFTNSKNKTGPRTEPCGTPDETSFEEKKQVIWERFNKNA